MKVFVVNKSFSPESRNDIVISEGSYPIQDWRNDGFLILSAQKSAKDGEIIFVKLFVVHKESHEFGKVIAKMGV